MKLQASQLELAPSLQSSTTHTHSDWSFLPTAAGGLTGVMIGLAIANILGWY
jgi:hypothetical protein